MNHNSHPNWIVIKKCQHLHLKYCEQCNVVYCEDCKEEWTKSGNWTYTNPWNDAGIVFCDTATTTTMPATQTVHYGGESIQTMPYDDTAPLTSSPSTRLSCM